MKSGGFILITFFVVIYLLLDVDFKQTYYGSV